MIEEYGPKQPFSQELHKTKYRGAGEDFKEAMNRVASALSEAGNDKHFYALREILLNMRFLPAGRVQSAMGAARQVTPYNCFVSRVIPDSMRGIMSTLADAADTMRMGGGIGYDFSTLRPKGSLIRTLDSRSGGVPSVMNVFDALCAMIASSGHRRGAQMGVLRVDHPDIEDFIHAKQNLDKLKQFNISVAVTDEFMEAMLADRSFDLRFEGRKYKTVSARTLWEEIMRSTHDYADPGVLFIDTINRMNNLAYCETIYATNPCGEQPLPPYGACLLGSFNLAAYIELTERGDWWFNWDQFVADIPVVVRAMDNVIDRSIYPLTEQEAEAKSKRRMGLGITGLANASEVRGMPYGSVEMLEFTDRVFKTLVNQAYLASSELAIEKGSFPAYNAKGYLDSDFLSGLTPFVRDHIREHGIRNSHLTSIAPTGTISLTADNISSGIEPVWNYEYDRVVQTFEGPITVTIKDYGWNTWGVKGKRAVDCTADEHLDVLITAQKYMDSSVSKTCNVSPDMPWEDFKQLYVKAWENGCKGCTTFTPGGKKEGILEAPALDDEGGACYIDPNTGQKECS